MSATISDTRPFKVSFQDFARQAETGWAFWRGFIVGVMATGTMAVLAFWPLAS